MSQLLPPRFIESLQSIQGFNKEAFLSVHDDVQPVTSVRVNPLKPTPAIEQLPLQDAVPWCSEGRYLAERPSFTLDPVFHGGAYYVQEASSMFLSHIIKEIYKNKQAPARVLDVCAAPGGKSTLLAAALPESFIVANEVIKTRVGILAENISKWGSDNVVVTNTDPKDIKKLPGYFDLMVVDAPCSGSGLFRKDQGAVTEWSEANVEMCSFRQRRILSDVVGVLKQEGYLIYSTCSYSRLENEDICDWIMDSFSFEPVKISIDPSWGIVETASENHQVPGYRFYPDKLRGEGFFIACFQQTQNIGRHYNYSAARLRPVKQIKAIVEPFLKNIEDYVLSDQKEIVIASLKKWEEEIATIAKVLNLRKSGIAVGTIKGKDLIPHHELALTHLLSPVVPVTKLDKMAALQYLRRQGFTTSIDKKGWAICEYEDINLGWIKVLPNRVNNYYPTNWRILKS